MTRKDRGKKAEEIKLRRRQGTPSGSDPTHPGGLSLASDRFTPRRPPPGSPKPSPGSRAAANARGGHEEGNTGDGEKRGAAGGDELLRCMDGASDKPPHKDYYKVLEVDYDASDDTIKLSYRRLALKWHPDKHKGDNDVTAKFQEINEAYTVLSDPSKRLEYDLSGCYELNRYTLREYLTRFKGMILTCNGLGIDHSSKW
uniref:J domain-containing protein n=1 Tax=Oryza punctata TaxID=4537 RepID=A0A0E0K3U9_ORYPU